MIDAHLDYETKSVADLKEVGLFKYSRDATTDAICAAFAFGEEEPTLWWPGMPYPERLRDHVAAGGKVYAHNAPFELAIWNNVMVEKHGWEPLPAEQAHCTMVMAYAMGLPGALEDVALALGVHLQKDMEGRALIMRMCRPRSRPGVTPVVWWDQPDKLERAGEYCKQDVRVERAVTHRMMPLSEKERRVWLLDYKINQRGVYVDRASVAAGAKMAEVIKEKCNHELGVLTGGEATTVTALIPLKAWLARHGVEADSLAKRDLADLLDDLKASHNPAAAKPLRALELRQEAGKASTAKLDKILDMLPDDDRLRNLYQINGAASGRWAGRGVQVHNLVRDMRKPAEVEEILDLVRRGEHEAIDMIYGPPLSEISRALRSFFCAPPGRVLVGGDWSNVESRGAAWFTGEQWKLDAFRAQDDGSGPDVYRLGASRLLQKNVADVTPEERQSHGKVPDLAFQYQGGVGSGHTMGKTYGVVATDAEWDERKVAWRANHPMIAKTWREVERSALSAVRTPGEAFACGFPGRQAHFKMVGSFLWLLLPSGRTQCFPYPKILDGLYGPQLTYMTVPSAEDRKKGKVIFDKMNSGNWVRIGTYGGALFNRIIQGFSADLLRDGLLEVDARGGEIALHTHDDLVVEVDADRGEAAQALLTRIMNTPAAWAKDFPLVAQVHIMGRYGK